jgi:hypothetical protein
MPLPLESLQAAVRITSFGDLLGTGFLVRVLSDAGLGSYSYLITPHHVIRNHVGIEVEVPNPFTNGALYAPVPVGDWRQPLEGVDLAVAPYLDGEQRNHHAVCSEAIWPGHPDLGARIYYIGMFEPLNRPIARSGTTAALEQEGIRHSSGAYDFPAHLVDCRSYRGFSGSPCSMEIAFARLNGKDVPEWIPQEDRPVAGMNYYTLLCGMFTSHYTDEDSPQAEGVISRYGVGVMLPSRFILEALMTDDACNERRQWDGERSAAKSQQQPPLQDASARSAKTSDEFFRFEDLAQKLVQVPKKELDDKRREEG